MSTTSGRQAGSSCTRWGEGPLDQVGSRPQTNALSCKLTLRWPCPGAAVESAHNWWCRPSNSTTHDSTRPPGGERNTYLRDPPSCTTPCEHSLSRAVLFAVLLLARSREKASTVGCLASARDARLS